MKRLLLTLFIVASLILPAQGNADITKFGSFLPCTTDDGTTCTTTRAIVSTSTISGLYRSSYSLLYGDTSNAKNTYGFTINQLAADDEILSLKSSDVAHGMTVNTETDTYFYIKKASATLGGNSIAGLSSGDGSGFKFWGVIGSNSPTATTPSMSFHSLKKDAGGTDVTALGATETAFSFQNSTTKLFTILGGGSAILGTSTAVGTSGAKVFMIDSGTAPTTSPADSAQMWVADFGGTAGKASIHARDEAGNITILGNSNITAGSGTGVTVNYNGHLNRQTYKVTTTYAAYADTDTKKGIVIATLPAKMKIVGCYADTTAAYTGGTVSAATLRVGVTAEDAAGILADHDVKTAAVTKGLADADMGTSMTRAAQIQGGYLPSWTGTTAIYATINTTDGNTNALTAGSTTFYIVTEQF